MNKTRFVWLEKDTIQDWEVIAISRTTGNTENTENHFGLPPLHLGKPSWTTFNMVILVKGFWSRMGSRTSWLVFRRPWCSEQFNYVQLIPIAPKSHSDEHIPLHGPHPGLKRPSFTKQGSEMFHETSTTWGVRSVYPIHYSEWTVFPKSLRSPVHLGSCQTRCFSPRCQESFSAPTAGKTLRCLLISGLGTRSHVLQKISDLNSHEVLNNRTPELPCPTKGSHITKVHDLTSQGAPKSRNVCLGLWMWSSRTTKSLIDCPFEFKVLVHLIKTFWAKGQHTQLGGGKICSY